jgi:hypothetical protein
MQKLWATKLNWDESLPIELHTTWNHFLQNFHALGDIRIPRLVISHQNHVHGFCDVSQRVLGDRMLNFEEMYTLLAMIEACLNSRPITPLSNDPHDLTSLTPGHFLIGTPLTAPAEDNIIEVPTNRLTRYQLITQMRQHFWRRWSQDYLHTLQQRTKWRSTPNDGPTVGALVIVKEDNTPPLHWPLGRITELHPGQDGKCRVVSVKTVRGVFKRPIIKICPV